MDSMSKAPQDNRPTVWSSQHGDLRKRSSKPAAQTSLPPQQQTAYLHRDSKGRGGKTVTLVENLALSEEDAKALSKKLKQACGSGGTVKDGVIEIQGEHRQKIAEVLRELGYKVKLAGG
ncbi:MAG: translation initiation factor [Chloroflexi bacterium]|nr:translation initiation factor [Chloroflexota bacterium]